MLACSLSPTSNAPAPAGSEARTEAQTDSPASVTAAPIGTPVPASATATGVHKAKPGSPGGVSGFQSDFASQPFAAQKRSIGDGCDLDLLERPFTSASMDYQPFLDATPAQISAGAPWIDVTIFVPKGPDASTLSM